MSEFPSPLKYAIDFPQDLSMYFKCKIDANGHVTDWVDIKAYSQLVTLGNPTWLFHGMYFSPVISTQHVLYCPVFSTSLYCLFIGCTKAGSLIAKQLPLFVFPAS